MQSGYGRALEQRLCMKESHAGGGGRAQRPARERVGSAQTLSNYSTATGGGWPAATLHSYMQLLSGREIRGLLPHGCYEVLTIVT